MEALSSTYDEARSAANAVEKLVKSRMKALPVTYRFAVTFFAGGLLPSPLDTRFKRVSGISSTIETETVVSGGSNMKTYKLPKRITHDNLVLERGVTSISVLKAQFLAAMHGMQFLPGTVMVSPLDENNNASLTGSWIFKQAYPVKWSISDMDGSDNNLVIETMEFTFSSLMHPIL